MDDLRALVASPEFEQVKADLLALDPALLVDPAVGSHLMAMRTGLVALANTVANLPAELPDEGEGEGEGEGLGGNEPAGEGPGEGEPVTDG